MKKFTKTLVAVATTALISGPAMAMVAGDYYGGSKASTKFSGSGCKSDKEKNLAMEIMFHTYGMGAPNSGYWESGIFRFGEAIDGEGPLIISKPGKTVEDAPKKATMDVDDEVFFFLNQRMKNYALECKDFVEFGEEYTQITRFDAAWSKNGERVDVKLDAKSMYYNNKDKDKNLTFKLRSGKLNRVINVPN